MDVSSGFEDQGMAALQSKVIQVSIHLHYSCYLSFTLLPTLPAATLLSGTTFISTKNCFSAGRLMRRCFASFLLLRTPPEGEAARFRQQKTIDNLRNQMLAIDIQLMREECAEGV